MTPSSIIWVNQCWNSDWISQEILERRRRVREGAVLPWCKKGTTCGLTCETMKWFTLNISEIRAMGRSLE